jgi:hypothetical protein
VLGDVPLTSGPGGILVRCRVDERARRRCLVLIILDVESVARLVTSTSRENRYTK